MWMGNYEPINLLGLLIQAIFIENFLLANFLGMCTYLACSTKLKTANGLGVAVVFVLTVSGILNWCVQRFVTAPGALSWLDVIGIDASMINLEFLQFLLFISVIAGFTQILEIAAIREKLCTSDVVPALKGMGITFIMTGLMAMAFQGFTGIKLSNPSGTVDISPQDILNEVVINDKS